MAWRVGALACAVLVVSCSGDDATGSPSDSAAAAAAGAATTTQPESSEPSEPSPSDAAQAGVVLDGEGLGIVGFGAAPEDVVEALNGVYGSPTDDTDWLARQEGDAGCPGTRLRIVRYGQLQLLMSDGPTDYGAAGQQHLFGYTVFEVHDGGPTPQTAEGIGVGSTVADLRAVYATGWWCAMTTRPSPSASPSPTRVAPSGSSAT